ncbi:hypothetical protein TELCIR_13106, partial [Teladorsagia circumcincta]
PVRAPPVPTRNDTKYGSDSIAIRWDDSGIDEDEAPVRFVQAASKLKISLPNSLSWRHVAICVVSRVGVDAHAAGAAVSSTDLLGSIAVRFVNVASSVVDSSRVRFVPVTSVLSPSSHDEELMVVENNSCVITDLRKYTEYQISVTPYNRAGEGAVAQIRVRTLEDVPGVVSALRFSDVLLDSVSYRELEPSSFYVFRVFARNEIGIGKASAETEQLFVPAFIPEDPFYTTWWFIAMVAMSTFVVVVLVVAFLCITGSVAKYKREKRDSVDSIHLANGNFVAFQMEASHRDIGRSRNDLPTRPGTKQSWLSDRDPPAYGSVLGDQSRLRGTESIDGGGSVVNMYGLTALVGRDVRGSAYITQREAVDMLNRSKYGSRGDYGVHTARSQSVGA